MQVSIEYDKLKRAIKQNPQNVKDESNRFLVKTQAIIKQGINQSPWKVGQSGGGVPVLSGNLKKAHEYTIAPFMFKVEVNTSKTSAGKWNYAELVHNGTSRMEARPWLRYVESKKEREINQEAKLMLERITALLGD